jgi:hypothetical protein
LAADSGITPINISDTLPFTARFSVTDTATLRLSTQNLKVNYTLYPGDSIADPLIAVRMQSAFWYRTKLIMPFAVIPGDTLIASQGPNLVFNTGDTSGLATTPRSDVTAELITRDFGATFELTMDMEIWGFLWWYQNLDADKASQPLDSLFVIQGAFGPMVSFLPPLDTAMHRFQIWVGASDSFLGEINRPVGKTNKTATGYFRYTQAYIDKHKK